jgi:uncharacterized membrane-anchored protein
MKTVVAATLFAACLFVLPASARAQDAAADPAQARALAEFIQSLHFQAGEVALADAGAHLHVQQGFRYLGHDDTRKVLEKLWGNPPNDAVLGLLVPDNAPLDSDHSWAVVVTYSDDGHVSDDDATKVDYAKVMADMKQASADENAERKKGGFEAVQIVGWATPPRYDAAGKRIYWARELEFNGSQQHTLNYDIRVLGREGYLSMNAVAGMNDLGMVQDGMTRVLPMAEFDSGHRYADFRPGHDKLAAYGLAALVGGGIAAKAGLFAKFGVILLALKKFIVLGVLAIGAFFRKMVGGKDKRSSGTVR